MRFERILCAVDFSDASDRALATAARVAAWFRAPLTLAHVVESVWSMGELPSAYVEVEASVRRGAEVALAARKETLAGLAPGVVVETVLLDGSPWDAVVRYGAMVAADLIVVGSHGRTGIKRVLVGSVAERVVRHASCAVLVARGEASAIAAGFRSIVCAVDFSDPSREAMRVAAEVAHRSHGLLTLVHVHVSGALPDEAAAIEEGKRRLAEWQVNAGELVGPDTVVGGVWRDGRAADELLRLAVEQGHDLVVVGTTGKGGVQRILVGSVAERVLRHAPCAVLVARAPGGG